MSSLVVVGAGPKAAAIAAKRHALSNCGYDVPEVLILEKSEIGANWNGINGYTSGTQRLGTPPEKDVGFPYSLREFPEEVVTRVFQEFSWGSYQITNQLAYGEWIDRGRPHPPHKIWSNYIEWVISRSEAKLEITEVDAILYDSGSWTVSSKNLNGEVQKHECQGVVFTGTGPSKKPDFEVPRHPHIFFGDNFWTNLNTLDSLSEDNDLPIVVFGGGETAASVVSFLIDYVPSEIPIVVITRGGALYSRGEGYYENRVFTESDLWRSLDEKVRKEVIRRGDRGVFSVDVVKKISLSSHVDHKTMEVTQVEIDESDFNRIILRGTAGEKFECQRLIFGLGFDPLWFLNIMPKEIRKKIDEIGGPSEIERNINRHLEIEHKDLPGGLFAPMAAGLAQGPGYPNLSCLGLLSDAIFSKYCGNGSSSDER